MEHKTKLFVFSKIYKNPGSLEEIIYSDDILDIEVEWHKYWREHGDMIVNSSWISLYSDYINPDYLDENLKKLNLTEENLTKVDGDNIHIPETDWQTLWDEQYHYEYSNCFKLFSENFYNAYKNFNLNQEFSSRKKSLDDLFSTVNESDHLKALGLPTEFASNTQYYKFKKKNWEHFVEEEFAEESNDEEEDKMSEILPEIENSYINEDSNEEEADKMSEISPEIANSYISELQNDTLNSLVPDIESIQSVKTPRKRKSKKRPLRKVPLYIREDKTLIKYWRKRFQLFSRFDQGIKLDKESWFSVTPEKIAQNIADRMSHCDIVIDGFCGSGGNCIQLAMKCKKVIAIDIDPVKIEMAKHNAKIYEVDKNIEFIVGDFFNLSDNLKADGVILSVPWGGPQYKDHHIYDIEKYLLPLPASELMERCRKITENISLFIPKNSDKKQVIRLAGVNKQVEIVQNYVDNRFVALTCYFGNLIKKKNNL